MLSSPAGPPRSDEQAAFLQRHLVSISEANLRTRLEISEIRQEQKVGRTRDELHAVVESTERATNLILTAAETVDTLARGIVQRTGDAAARMDAQAIQEQMQTVFGACNFQDLTGQRISKVVRTIVLVEERAAEMLRVWPGPVAMPTSVTPLPPRPAANRNSDEDGLLNGPALPGTAAVSQDAVDAMFG